MDLITDYLLYELFELVDLDWVHSNLNIHSSSSSDPLTSTSLKDEQTKKFSVTNEAGLIVSTPLVTGMPAQRIAASKLASLESPNILINSDNNEQSGTNIDSIPIRKLDSCQTFCPILHLFPRFVRTIESVDPNVSGISGVNFVAHSETLPSLTACESSRLDGESKVSPVRGEVLPASAVLQYLLDEALKPLFRPEELMEISNMTVPQFSAHINNLRGTLATLPGKVSSNYLLSIYTEI
ncbi:unnamed protein product [Protopolystoma xenopodis]|uniref:Uncharacterized protein n=1 Tax=Protopolystoma xenopodis TaxID=117903 RepID=A0A3S4ZW56_9PLAT|nr:unnamed protein product [Protopolystoma xenopodis]